MASFPQSDSGVVGDMPAYRPDGIVHWHTSSAYSVPQSTTSDLRNDGQSQTYSRQASAMSIPQSTIHEAHTEEAVTDGQQQAATTSTAQTTRPLFVNEGDSRDRRASELSESSSSTIKDKQSDDAKEHVINDRQPKVTAPAKGADLEKQTINQESQDGKDKDNEDEDEEKRDPNVVDWDGKDDPLNPMNWKPLRKWTIACAMGLMTFVVTFASSVFSSATMVTAMQFGVSSEVMTLGTSLFVLGFAFGPIFWGPFSELYGRKIPLFTGYIIFAIFLVPVAVAQNLWTIMICRFFGGFFASAPLAIVGGSLADFFDPVNRGVAMSIFCASTFIGPTMGPLLGGFITMSHLGWRWTQWINLLMAGLMGTSGFFIIPESYAPVILQRKAKKLRYETRNWAIRAQADEKQVNLQEIVEQYLLRPFKMLALEPILVLITLYMSLIYGIIYGFFEVFPIAFQEERGWNMGVGALPFLSVLVGVVIGCLIISAITKTRFKHKMEEVGLIPEERLIPMIIGSVVLPAGLFWFAWTSSPNISPWPQIISCAPIGAGLMMIFLQGLNYIIDVYKMNANSAIAANTFFRSWVGAGFPLFATPMFHNLGIPWAMSLLAFLCVALFPCPVLFFIFGKKIRKMSKYSPD